MKIGKDIVNQRIARYMTERLMPQASLSGKFKIGFAMPLVPRMVEQYWEAGESLGLVDAEGLDVDALGACMKSGVEHAGALEIQGFRFDANDVGEFIASLKS